MIELRYFSGTGNSKRMLQVCRDAFAAAGRRTRLASVTTPLPLDPETELLGLAFPVYSFGLPRIVKKYLAALPPAPGRRAFLLATIGGHDEEGWALRDGRRLLEAKGYAVVDSDTVHTPDNWLPMATVPDAAEAREILAEAEPLARAIAARILAGTSVHKPFFLPKFGPFWSRVMYYSFHYHGVHELWRFFKTTSACSACGICAAYCPLHAIRMERGRPVWSRACEQCMRCINYCPEKAIRQLELLGHGSRRFRYHEPHFLPKQDGEIEVV